MSRTKVQVSKKKFLSELEKITGVHFERREAELTLKSKENKLGFSKQKVVMRAWVGSNGEAHPSFAGLYSKYRRMVEKEHESEPGRDRTAG